MEAGRTGRIVGVLLLLQIVGGALANFVLMAPVLAAPGFLVNAAANSLNVSLSVLIALATGGLSVAIAIAAFPLFRQHSEAMALWFVALAVVNLSSLVVENVGVLSMLSLSQAYATASAADSAVFQTLSGVVGSARNWAHYANLIVAGGMVLVFYGAMYRFALIPRALAAFGLAAGLLLLAAVAMPLFGYRIVLLLVMPLAVSNLALALWLLVKGFTERGRP